MTERRQLSLGEQLQARFRGVSNDELMRRMIQAPDFGYDDEEYELNRRLHAVGKAWRWTRNDLGIETYDLEAGFVGHYENLRAFAQDYYRNHGEAQLEKVDEFWRAHLAPDWKSLERTLLDGHVVVTQMDGTLKVYELGPVAVKDGDA